MRQFAAIFGRADMTTLPLISALALRFLMFTLPICFATLPPSRPPSASPTAPVAFADSEPVTFSVPVSGVASVSTSCAPVAADRPARGGPADIGILQDLRDRIVGLAGEGSRRAAIGGVADRRQRNRNRRHHGGCARRRRQRRQFGERGRPVRGARRDEVHHLQAGRKRDDDDRERDRNRLQMHRQTHRPPGSQLNRPARDFTGAARATPLHIVATSDQYKTAPANAGAAFHIKKR